MSANQGSTVVDQAALNGVTAGVKRVKLTDGAQAPVSEKDVRDAWLRQYSETGRFRLGIPKMFKFTPDGASVLFLRSGPRSQVHDLYEYVVATGEERLILTADTILQGVEEKLSEEERLRRERLRMSARGIASYQLSPCGELLLVPLSGKVYAIVRNSIGASNAGSAGPIVREIPVLAGASEVRYSPDGSMIAFVRESKLYVVSAPQPAAIRAAAHVLTSEPLQVSPTPASSSIEYGLPEYVAQEEMDRFTGYWWSPNSRAIVFQETDTTGMETLTLSDPGNPTGGSTQMAYPRVGTKNARVRLALATISVADDSREAVPTSAAIQGWFDPTQVTTVHPRLDAAAAKQAGANDTMPFEYVTTVRWIDSSAFFVALQTRCQRVLRLIELSTPADHKGGAAPAHSASSSPLLGSSGLQEIVATSHPSCSGSLLMRELLEERDAAWTTIDQTVPVAIEKGTRFLWSSRVSGYPTLQIRSRRTGAVQAVLTDNLIVYRGVIHVDVARGVVFVRGGPNASEEHIYGVPLPRPSASTVLSSLPHHEPMDVANATSGSPTLQASSSGGCPGSPSFNPADAPKRSFTVPPAFLLTRGSGMHSAVFGPKARQALFVHVFERPFAPPVIRLEAWDFPETVFQPAGATHDLDAAGAPPPLSLPTSGESKAQGSSVSHSAEAGFVCLTGPREGVFSREPDFFYEVEDEPRQPSKEGQPPAALQPLSTYLADQVLMRAASQDKSPYLYFAVSKLGSLQIHSEAPSIRRPYEFASLTLESGRKMHAFICYPPGFFSIEEELEAEKVAGVEFTRTLESGSRSKAKFPLIVSVYGGPGFRMVSASSLSFTFAQFLAAQGYVVLVADGRGTPYRGSQWEHEIRYEHGVGPVNDQADAVRALCSLPVFQDKIDSSRVGIYGWSYGGYVSALAGMLRPDVFKACVAGAPVTDWMLYDTHYTERFLGVPKSDISDLQGLDLLDAQDANKAYEISSVLTYADKLESRLLLIHGTSDENVVFGHSLVLSDCLFKLGKEHGFLPLLNQTHMVAKPQYVFQLNQHIIGHFDKYLK